MRVLVVGAGRVGSKVLLQLRKNPTITVFTVDPREDPQAVRDGIIEVVDYRRELTPRELEATAEVPIIAVSRASG